MMPQLEDIYNILDLNALSIQELDDYYYNLFDSRGDNPIKTIKRRLLGSKDMASGPGHLHILFSGFRGCGKSTELNKMQQELKDDFFILNLSVNNELDPINFVYTDLVILIMQRLFELTENEQLDINENLLKSIEGWKNTEEIKRVRDFSNEFEAGVEGKAGWSIPVLTAFFVTLKNVTKINYTAKKTVNEVVEHQLNDLIKYCNDLIREIKLKLHEKGKGLLIIVEDTDKLNIDLARKLFLVHSTVFTSLKTNLIFTYPIALKCSQDSQIINTTFNNNVFELPMVKVNNKDGSENARGVRDMQHLIEKRGIMDCFGNAEVLKCFIRSSGGCIRDLFRMIVGAADAALDDDKTKIDESHYKKAFVHLKRTYKDTIAEKERTDGSKVEVEDYYRVLNKLNVSTSKQLDNTEVDLDLRHNLCILGYNGDGWYDVHPAVKEILKERNAESIRS